MTFEQWLSSKEGQECQTWPITDIQYLRNRLWWAFNAGVQEGSYPKPTAKTGAES